MNTIQQHAAPSRRGRPPKPVEERKTQFSVYLSQDAIKLLGGISDNLSSAIETLAQRADEKKKS